MLRHFFIIDIEIQWRPLSESLTIAVTWRGLRNKNLSEERCNAIRFSGLQNARQVKCWYHTLPGTVMAAYIEYLFIFPHKQTTYKGILFTRNWPALIPYITRSIGRWQSFHQASSWFEAQNSAGLNYPCNHEVLSSNLARSILRNA